MCACVRVCLCACVHLCVCTCVLTSYLIVTSFQIISISSYVVVVTLSALVSCPLLVGSLRCHSTQSCDAGTRFCNVTCTHEFHYCTAFYQITLEGTLQPVLMGCAMGNDSITIPTTCIQNLHVGPRGLIHCDCKSDLCNALFNHSEPPPTPTPTPPYPISVVSEKPDENYSE